MPYTESLATYQWARETVAGTDLPATSKMIVPKLILTPQDAAYRPPITRGLIQRNRGFETAVKRWTKWSVNGPASYDQLQHYLCMGVVNVAAPTILVWTFVRNPAAIPVMGPFTFERSETDGTTPISHAVHYALADQIQLSAAEGDVMQMQASGFARRMQTEVITAALTMPAAEFGATGLSKVYIDPSWATLGTTQVATQVLGWSFQFNTGLTPLWTMDARSDLDYSTHGVDHSNVQIQASILCLIGAQYATELAAAEAQTLRAVRIQIDDTVGPRQLQIDFLAKYSIPNLREFGERNGQRLVELKLEESTDGSNLLQMKLTNVSATLV